MSNAYRDVLAEYGLRLSGQSPDGGLVEMIELPDHPWFLGCQFHPELKSRPTRPHPLFAGFVGAALAPRRSGGPPSPAPTELAEIGALMGWSFARTPFLIAGPCVVEPGDVLPRVAEALARLGAARGHAGLLQGQLRQGQSRPRRRAARARDWTRGSGCSSGCGPRAGCRCSPTSTRPAQAAPAAEVVDALQIPAFLCRQTDLLVAAGRTGQAGEREEGAVDAGRGDGAARWRRCERPAARDVAVTERGTFFGYGDLVVDMRNFDRLRAATGAPVIFDATHCGAAAGAGRGRRERGPARAHPRCSWPRRRRRAPTGSSSRPIPTRRARSSDAATQWPLDRLDALRRAARSDLLGPGAA